MTSLRQRALRHPSFAIGLVLTTLLVAVAALSLVWTPHSPYEIDMALRLRAPDARHWLGTDPYGRDIVSLLLVGARASIVVGVIAGYFALKSQSKPPAENAPEPQVLEAKTVERTDLPTGVWASELDTNHSK